ncbi:MAG: TRAP transporter small permease subunit [Burkholderiales bacterium]|nr:TRAP transporter small permease subunit [Burkholderiales bacterium]
MIGVDAQQAASTPLAAADRRLGRIEDALNLAGAAAIFAVMLFGVAQIVSRVVSGWLHQLVPALPPFAIYGYIDYIEYVAVLYAFLGIAYCQRVGGHIRMELLVAGLRGRWMWAAETAAALIAVIVTLLLIAGTWDTFYNAWKKGDSTMDINLPLWPSKLVVPVLLAVLLARLLVQLWGYVRLLRDPLAPPLAVPLPESLTHAAQREAEEAMARIEQESASRAPR